MQQNVCWVTKCHIRARAAQCPSGEGVLLAIEGGVRVAQQTAEAALRDVSIALQAMGNCVGRQTSECRGRL